jgi:hypothetical protein
MYHTSLPGVPGVVVIWIWPCCRAEAYELRSNQAVLNQLSAHGTVRLAKARAAPWRHCPPLTSRFAHPQASHPARLAGVPALCVRASGGQG